jgi:hypothetical protein
LFYQALNVVLEVVLDDELELDDYVVNFRRMYGNARMRRHRNDVSLMRSAKFNHLRNSGEMSMFLSSISRGRYWQL